MLSSTVYPDALSVSLTQRFDKDRSFYTEFLIGVYI